MIKIIDFQAFKIIFKIFVPYRHMNPMKKQSIITLGIGLILIGIAGFFGYKMYNLKFWEIILYIYF